jgi:hypothetical protein
MYVTRTFLMVQPGQEFWEPQENELPFGGGHAMVVTGYDYGKEAFEIMNSWGTGWGNDGFIWVKFEDFGRFCKYGFQMILEEKPTDVNVALTALKGTFEFQSFVGENEEGGYDFKVEPVVHQQGYRYELEQRQWETGGKGGFQLIAKDVPEGKYVYVFGIDPENEVEVFWPNQDELVERLEENEEMPEDIDALRKVKISSVVSSDRAEMIIPHEDYFLMLDKKGEDHLIKTNKDEFNKMLKRVSILATDNYKGAVFTFNENNLAVTATNPDYGESKEDMKIEFEGDSIEAAFNPKYFLDALNVIEDENVIINIVNADRPCIVQGENEANFISVIMPMKI